MGATRPRECTAMSFVARPCGERTFRFMPLPEGKIELTLTCLRISCEAQRCFSA